jgi:hypothetical protein
LGEEKEEIPTTRRSQRVQGAVKTPPMEKPEKVPSPRGKEPEARRTQ